MSSPQPKTIEFVQPVTSSQPELQMSGDKNIIKIESTPIENTGSKSKRCSNRKGKNSQTKSVAASQDSEHALLLKGNRLTFSPEKK